MNIRFFLCLKIPLIFSVSQPEGFSIFNSNSYTLDADDVDLDIRMIWKTYIKQNSYKSKLGNIKYILKGEEWRFLRTRLLSIHWRRHLPSIVDLSSLTCVSKVFFNSKWKEWNNIRSKVAYQTIISFMNSV